MRLDERLSNEEKRVDEALETIASIIRRVRMLLATMRVTLQIAHEIIMLEMMAKNLGVYDEFAEEIEELKRAYVALYYGGIIAGQRSYEQRVRRARRGVRRAAASWTLRVER